MNAQDIYRNTYKSDIVSDVDPFQFVHSKTVRYRFGLGKHDRNKTTTRFPSPNTTTLGTIPTEATTQLPSVAETSASHELSTSYLESTVTTATIESQSSTFTSSTRPPHCIGGCDNFTRPIIALTTLDNDDFNFTTDIYNATLATTDNATDSHHGSGECDTGVCTAVIYTYASIVVIGTILNIGAILAICCLRRLRNTQNIFMLNLYFADILIGVNAITLFIAEVDEGVIQNKDTICPIVGFLSFLSPVAIVLSMCVIAANRYRVITLNKHDMTSISLAFYLTLVWTISVLVSLPILIGDLEVEAGYFCYCCFFFASNVTYGAIITVFMYILPNLVIAFCYLRIVIHVRESRKRVAQIATLTTGKSNTKKRGDIFVARQFIILSAVFNICYLPIMTVSWLEGEHSSVSIGVSSFVVLLFGCNMIANPVLYFIMNRNAKEAVRQSLCCQKIKQPKLINQIENALKQRNCESFHSPRSEPLGINSNRKKQMSLRTRTLKLGIQSKSSTCTSSLGEHDAVPPVRKQSWLDHKQTVPVLKTDNNAATPAVLESPSEDQRKTISNPETPVKHLRKRNSISYNEVTVMRRRSSLRHRKLTPLHDQLKAYHECKERKKISVASSSKTDSKSTLKTDLSPGSTRQHGNGELLTIKSLYHV